jgi:hypothetical protein
MSSSQNSIMFRGKTGERYYFQALPIEAKLKAIGGVYIVTRRTYEDRTFPTKASHRPLAIGHTDDLSMILAEPSERARLERLSANCICVYADQDEQRRVEIEQDVLEGNAHWLEQLQYVGGRT